VVKGNLSVIAHKYLFSGAFPQHSYNPPDNKIANKLNTMKIRGWKWRVKRQKTFIHTQNIHAYKTYLGKLGLPSGRALALYAWPQVWSPAPEKQTNKMNWPTQTHLILNPSLAYDSSRLTRTERK
jgi:hypothetical protein